MQSGLIFCVLALASNANAGNLRQEAVQTPVTITDLMTTQAQPQSATQQPERVVSTIPQVVTDAALLAQNPRPQPDIQGTVQPAASAPQVTSPSRPEARNVTKIAFGQITDLGTEFHQLREDDQNHVKQLGVDIHLREHLEQELHEAEERLEHDNDELAQETTGIGVAAAPGDEVKMAQGGSGESPPALVQAKSIKVQAETDQIALATARDVKTLNADINTLHIRDVDQVKALRGNAETRSALSAQIAREREELLADSGGLATNLGQIRELVAPSQAAPADPNSDAVASSSEALPQQSAPASAEQQAASPPVAAVADSAPEASGSSAWLR